MKLSSLNPESVRRQRLERWRRDCAAAQTVRAAFPHVERICIDLVFKDDASCTPASQSHFLYPPARAFFEFRCPHADCDGQLDLKSAIADFLARSAPQVEGELDCPGTRVRDRSLSRQPCGLHVKYSLTVEYRIDRA